MRVSVSTRDVFSPVRGERLVADQNETKARIFLINLSCTAKNETNVVEHTHTHTVHPAKQK